MFPQILDTVQTRLRSMDIEKFALVKDLTFCVQKQFKIKPIDKIKPFPTDKLQINKCFKKVKASVNQDILGSDNNPNTNLNAALVLIIVSLIIE